MNRNEDETNKVIADSSWIPSSMDGSWPHQQVHQQAALANTRSSTNSSNRGYQDCDYYCNTTTSSSSSHDGEEERNRLQFILNTLDTVEMILEDCTLLVNNTQPMVGSVGAGASASMPGDTRPTTAYYGSHINRQ